MAKHQDPNMEIEMLTDDDLDSVSGGHTNTGKGATCNTSTGSCTTKVGGTCNTSGSGTCSNQAKIAPANPGPGIGRN